MKKNLKCPQCNGNEIYVAEISARAEGLNLLPGVGGIFRNIAKLENYVCAECGLTQLFVPERHIPGVKSSKYFKKMDSKFSV